jgi:hypothetical protein
VLSTTTFDCHEEDQERWAGFIKSEPGGIPGMKKGPALLGPAPSPSIYLD